MQTVLKVGKRMTMMVIILKKKTRRMVSALDTVDTVD